MSTHGNPNDSPSPRPEQDFAEKNLARLLREVYRPERPNAAFVQRVQARMLQTARQAAGARRVSVRMPQRRLWALAAAAALAGVIFGLQSLLRLNHRCRPLCRRLGRGRRGRHG